MKRIVIYLVFCAFFLCGCQMKTEKAAGEKLYLSIVNNNIQGVKEVLRDEEIDLEKLPVSEWTEFSSKDRTALGIAISNCVDMRIFQMLIDADADVNRNTKSKYTYLMKALEESDYSLCKELLENGADVNAKNEDGLTAIDIWFGFEQDEYVDVAGVDVWEMAELLIDYGAEISDKTLEAYIDASGYSCGKRLIEYLRENDIETGIVKDLEYAILGDDEKLLKYLQKNSPSDKDKVVRFAAANCNALVLEKLEQLGCDLTIVDEQGQNLCLIAAKKNEKDALQYMMKNKKILRQKTNFYQIDVLSAAIIGANEENVELLRNEGMDWQRDGVDGGDVWIAACHAGQTDSVNILLEKDFAPTNEEIVYDLKVVMI